MLKPKKDKQEQLRNKSREWLKYSGMGFQLLGTILVFTLGGHYLDNYLGWTPALTVTLALLGVVGGLYVALRDFL